MSDSPNSRTHEFKHISRFLPRTYQGSQTPRHTPTPAPLSASINNAFIVAATTVVLVATPAALYFLVSENLLSSLAALVTALASAFGPKIYADFIQRKAASSAVIQNPWPSRAP
jgi:hypothetical protein